MRGEEQGDTVRNVVRLEELTITSVSKLDEDIGDFWPAFAINLVMLDLVDGEVRSRARGPRS